MLNCFCPKWVIINKKLLWTTGSSYPNKTYVFLKGNWMYFLPVVFLLRYCVASRNDRLIKWETRGKMGISKQTNKQTNTQSHLHFQHNKQHKWIQNKEKSSTVPERWYILRKIDNKSRKHYAPCVLQGYKTHDNPHKVGL